MLASADREQQQDAADAANGADAGAGDLAPQESGDTLDPGVMRLDVAGAGQGTSGTEAHAVVAEGQVGEAEIGSEAADSVASTLQSASNLDFNLPGVASAALGADSGNGTGTTPHAEPVEPAQPAEDEQTSLDLDPPPLPGPADQPADPTAVTMLMDGSSAAAADGTAKGADESGTAVNLALADDTAGSAKAGASTDEDSHTRVSLNVAEDLEIPPAAPAKPATGAVAGPRKATSSQREPGSGVRSARHGSGVRPGTRGSGIRPASTPGSGVRPGRPPTRAHSQRPPTQAHTQRPPTQAHTRSGTRGLSATNNALPPTRTNMSAGLTAEGAGAGASGERSLRHDPFIDLDVGGCKIIEKVGEGGMGAVYKARHLGLDKVVAIKILPPHLTDSPHRIERFKREAKSAAQMEHPNIVQILNVGEQDGIHFIIMQFIHGEDLRKRLKREGTIPADECIDIAIQICKGLKIAHDKLIVHRDIKPDNIMFDEEGRVKITDFGLAKGIDQDVEISNPGRAVGTPYYMSPEQCASREIDGRSDIYSLGATLFHMATGSRPFQGETPVATALMHLREPLVPPRQVNPDVPELLDAIIRRMMGKLPEERYQDCSALIDALEAADSALRGHSPLSSVRDIIGYTGPASDAPDSGDRPPIVPLKDAAGASGRSATTGIRRDGSRAGALAVAGGAQSGVVAGSGAAGGASDVAAGATSPVDGPFAEDEEPAPPKAWWPFAVLGAGALVFFVCLAIFLSSGSGDPKPAPPVGQGGGDGQTGGGGNGPRPPVIDWNQRAQEAWAPILSKVEERLANAEVGESLLAIDEIRDFLKVENYANTAVGAEAQAKLDEITSDLNERREAELRVLQNAVDRAVAEKQFARAKRHVMQFSADLRNDEVDARLNAIEESIVTAEGRYVSAEMGKAEALLTAAEDVQSPSRYFEALAIYNDLADRVSLPVNQQRVNGAAQSIEDKINGLGPRWNQLLIDQLEMQKEAARKFEIYIRENFPDKLRRGELADLRNVIELLPRQIPELQTLRAIPAQLLMEIATLQEVWDRLPGLLSSHRGTIKLRNPKRIGSTIVHNVRGPFEDCEATEFTIRVDNRSATLNYSELAPTELIDLLEDRYGSQLDRDAPEWARYFLLSQDDSTGLRNYMAANGMRPQNDELYWRFRVDLRGEVSFLRVYEVLDEACEAAILARQGNTNKAQLELARVLLVHERLGIARLAFAEIKLLEGDPAAALQHIERCFKLEQADPPAQLLAARANLSLGFTADTTRASRALFNAAFTASDAIVGTFETLRARIDAGGPDAEALQRLYDASAGYYLPQAYTIRALCYLLRADRPVYIFAANDLIRALRVEPRLESAYLCLSAKNEFEALDKNGDGLLVRAEFPADDERQFRATFDIAPSDGTVTLIEYLGVRLSPSD